MRLIKRNIQKLKILIATFLILLSQAITPLAFLVAPVHAAPADDVGKICTVDTTAPCVDTDLDDYAPDGTVNIHGFGYEAETTLTVELKSDTGPFVGSKNVTADEQGGISTLFILDGVYRPIYKLSVIDSSNSVLATDSFTDGRVINSANLNGVASVSVAPGASITANITGTTSGTFDNWECTSWNISGPGGTGSNTSVNITSDTRLYKHTFPITAPSAPGEYDISFTIHYGNTCANSSGNASTTLTDAITVEIDAPEPAPNPPLVQACGLDIALVLDVSGSINDTELGKMKAAFNAFVDAFLPATPTQFSVSEFSTTANVLQEFSGDATAVKAAITSANDNGHTNWEDGLKKGHGTYDPRTNPDLMVFASDGNPNTIGNGPADNAAPDGSAAAMNPAITAANAIKADNIRIVTLGIGDNLSTTNLEKISSSDAVITADFDELAKKLAEFAAELCGGTITTTKLIDADGKLDATDDKTPAKDWEFTVAESSYTTDSEGKTKAVEVDPGTYSVAETIKDGYEVLDVDCRIDGKSVGEWQPGSSTVTGIEVGATDIVSCTFINREAPKGSITIIKDAQPNSSQDFKFKALGEGVDDFTLDDDADGTLSNTKKFDNLKDGGYSFVEEQTTAYSLSKVECVGADGSGITYIKDGAAIKLVEGEDITCTFINERNPATFYASKIVCTVEAELPNWGTGGSDITAQTAIDWVKDNDSCEFAEGWEFQWSWNGVGNPGDNEEYGGTGWNTFGETDSSGVTSTEIDDLSPETRLWFREVLQNGYLPFTFGAGSNADDVSAEFYCNNDVLNYDNWDWIDNAKYGESYYCVAWNVELGQIRVTKYEDINLNGIRDNNEPRLDGWTMTLLDDENNELATGLTGEDGEGRVIFDSLKPGTYKVCETMKDGWVYTEPVDGSLCRTISIDGGDDKVARFGNAKHGDVVVTKYHDLNENGIKDDNEPTLEGWDMTLSEFDKKLQIISVEEAETLGVTQTTGEDGTTTFTDVDPTKIYTLKETLKEGWQQTGMVCDQYYVTVVTGKMLYRPTSLREVIESPTNGDSYTTKCFVGNTYEPVLTIDKSNDKPEATVVGDEVTYQITVTVPEESGCVYRENFHYYPTIFEAKQDIALELPHYMFMQNCDTEESVPNEIAQHLQIIVECFIEDECEKPDLGEVMVTDLPPEGFAYVLGSWEAYSNVRGDLKSAGITTEPAYSSPGQWNLTSPGSPFLVPGEVVTLTYVALIDSAVTNGDYPDTAFVEGYTNGGEQIYGNLHFTGDDPFVGTQVTVTSVTETDQGYVLGTLQVTGSPAILAPIIGALLAVGAVLTVTNRKKRRLFKGLGKSLASLGLGLMISVFMFSSAFAAGFWTTNISTPEAFTTTGAVNIDYQVTSTDAVDTFDVSLLQDGSSILMQTVTTPYGDSGRFPLTLTTEGTYTFQTTTDNLNGGGTKLSSEVTVTFDKTAPTAPTYNGVTRSGDTYTVNFTAPTGDVSAVNIYASTATQFDLDASTLVGTVTVTSGETTSFTYTAPDSEQRYFAITAVDAAGNQSPAVGDQETVTTVVPVDGSSDGTADDGTVSDDAATTDAGVEGTTDENADDDSDDTATIVAMSGIILFIVLAGAAYFMISTNRKRQE